VGVVWIAGLVLVACGGEDDGTVSGGGSAGPGTAGAGTSDAGADAYVQAAAEAWSEDQPDGVTVGRETAICMVTAIVELVGLDELVAAEVSPTELAAAEGSDDLGVAVPDGAAGELAEGLGDCDLAELMIEAVVEQMIGDPDGELPAEATTCLAGTIDHRAAAEAWAVDYVDGADALPALIVDALEACPEATTAFLLTLAGTSGSAPPEVEACVLSVVEANSDLVRAWLDDEPGASPELGRLITDTCPGIAG
jgi:hypothetical protein